MIWVRRIVFVLFIWFFITSVFAGYDTYDKEVNRIHHDFGTQFKIGVEDVKTADYEGTPLVLEYSKVVEHGTPPEYKYKKVSFVRLLQKIWLRMQARVAITFARVGDGIYRWAEDFDKSWDTLFSDRILVQEGIPDKTEVVYSYAFEEIDGKPTFIKIKDRTQYQIIGVYSHVQDARTK